MKKFGKAFISVLVLSVLSFGVIASESEESIASAAFSQGTVAFKNGEWMSAVFMLRRAVSYPENYNQETLYMLISAEMYASEYKSAFQDSENFLKSFPDSP